MIGSIALDVGRAARMLSLIAEEKENWQRAQSPQQLTVEQATQLIGECSLSRECAPLARKTVAHLELLSGGLMNTNYRVHFVGSEWSVVLRFYVREPTACAREVALLRLVSSDVPVAEVLHAEPNGIQGFPPFAILEYVDGILFRTLRRTKDQAAIAQAATAIGKTLTTIASYKFPRQGLLGTGLEVSPWLIDGPDTIPRLVDACLGSEIFRRRVDARWAERIHKFAWEWSEHLSPLDGETSLVHSDFNAANIMVKHVQDSWRVVAVLDWEFSFSGSTLWDIGNFLRYERKARPLVEPFFSQGCIDAGMALPDDWRRIARAADICSLCEILTRESLPADVVEEIVKLVRATVEDRDPE